MKTEFINYLDNIGVSDVMKNTVIEKYKMLCAATSIDEFDDLFFSEMISNRGMREYFSLWTFTSGLICKISIGKGADADDKITIFKGKKNIARFVINDYNFDFINPAEDSYLYCTIRTFDMDIPFGLSASGKNCTYLMKITNKYIVANLED